LNPTTTDNAWLTLAITPGIGAAHLTRLLDHFGTAETILAASAADLRRAGLNDALSQALQHPDESRWRAASEWLQQDNCHMVHWQHELYPSLLEQTGESPPVLFVAGAPDALVMPQIAIVGSRNATAGGKEIAQGLAGHLARSGFAITSGLARGVDTAAHRGALQASGRTIAVLGTGPDTVYPRGNAQLADQISTQGGALVSEFAPGVPACRENFPRRNRIISGLSVGVVVVEAGMRSGSLITARLSGTYGREVFAVPGSIHSPLSKGCHRLIKQGAKLVENSQDIVCELSALIGITEQDTSTQAAAKTMPRHADPDYAKLLRSMSFDPVDVEALIDRSGLTAGELSSMLLILELEGRVESLPGGRFQQLTGWNKPNE